MDVRVMDVKVMDVRVMDVRVMDVRVCNQLQTCPPWSWLCGTDVHG